MLYYVFLSHYINFSKPRLVSLYFHPLTHNTAHHVEITKCYLFGLSQAKIYNYDLYPLGLVVSDLFRFTLASFDSSIFFYGMLVKSAAREQRDFLCFCLSVFITGRGDRSTNSRTAW